MAFSVIPLSAHRPPLIVCPCASCTSPSPPIVLVVQVDVSVVLCYLFMLSRRSHRLRRHPKVSRHRFDNRPLPSFESSRRRSLDVRQRHADEHHAHVHRACCGQTRCQRQRTCDTAESDPRMLLSIFDIVSPLCRCDQSSRYLLPSPSHPPTILVSSFPIYLTLAS